MTAWLGGGAYGGVGPGTAGGPPAHGPCLAVGIEEGIGFCMQCLGWICELRGLMFRRTSIVLLSITLSWTATAAVYNAVGMRMNAADASSGCWGCWG